MSENKHTAGPLELADELMAMAPSVEAATAEGAASVLREAAYQLRISHGLLEALKDARYALYGNGAGNPKIDAAIAKAEGRS